MLMIPCLDNVGVSLQSLAMTVRTVKMVTGVLERMMNLVVEVRFF